MEFEFSVWTSEGLLASFPGEGFQEKAEKKNGVGLFEPQYLSETPNKDPKKHT